MKTINNDHSNEVMRVRAYVVQKVYSDGSCENFGIFSSEERANSFIEKNYSNDPDMFVTEIELDKPVSF